MSSGGEEDAGLVPGSHDGDDDAADPVPQEPRPIAIVRRRPPRQEQGRVHESVKMHFVDALVRSEGGFFIRRLPSKEDGSHGGFIMPNCKIRKGKYKFTVSALATVGTRNVAV
jgi:hypothetical protein